MYRVDSVGDGGWPLDSATTHDMGVGYKSADAQREVALSYAQAMLAQWKRLGVPATVTVSLPNFGEVIFREVTP